MIGWNFQPMFASTGPAGCWYVFNEDSVVEAAVVVATDVVEAGAALAAVAETPGVATVAVPSSP